ncbi:MAG: DUF2914 domain-containing protein [Geopsychrobacter sp.]|nr:DUF2914 domain-containing protein [Geopsychrobacter sp.]
MMKFLLFFLLLVSPVSVFALTAPEVVVTTGVENRAPVDLVEVYPAQAGRLYCFSRIEGAVQDTHIEHVWFYKGQEMARVSLPVRSARWRTYSSKRMLPEWKGEWQVRVVDAMGQELAEVTFRVE